MPLPEDVKRKAADISESLKEFFIDTDTPARDGFSKDNSAQEIIADDISQVKDSYEDKAHAQEQQPLCAGDDALHCYAAVNYLFEAGSVRR
jgi:hypothetical protein